MTPAHGGRGLSAAERTQLLATATLDDTAGADRFDRIVRLAARVLDVPIAMINLVGDRQWTKAAHGIEAGVTPLEDSICRHVVESGPMHVPDLAADPRFSENVFVAGPDSLQFYAGIPVSVSGEQVGTLCVLDRKPRTLSDEQLALLRELAGWAEAELNNAELNALSAAAREREQRLRSLLDATPEAVLVVDHEGQVSAENRVARDLFGLEEGQRQPLDQVLVGDQVDREAFQRADETGTPVRTRLRARRTSGEQLELEVTVSTWRTEGQQARLVLARDLTEDRRVGERLRRQERLNGLLLEATGDGVVGTDLHGTIVFANPAATEVLQCTEADLVNHSLHEVVHHSHADGTPFAAGSCDLHAAITGGSDLPAREDTFWRLDGSPVPVETRVSPIRVDGQLLGAVTTIRDISGRKEVERLKAEFVGVVSHELRTPLTSIRGSLDLLDAGIAGPLTEEQQPLLRMAVLNTRRLGNLVDDILDIERLDEGRMPLHPEPADATEIAAGIVEFMQPAARVREVTLAGSWTGPAPVRVDRGRITQAVTNLVGNALKFTPAGGTVTLAVTAGVDEVVMEVRDSGPGIPEDELETIFERFRQSRHSASSATKGTGLGLSIARGIVERSGGQVAARSRLGEGSTFSVHLPRREDDDNDQLGGC